MEWLQFKDAALGFILTGAVTYAAWQIRGLSKSTNTLNIKIGEILTHLEYHREELKDHKERIRRLETNRKQGGFI